MNRFDLAASEWIQDRLVEPLLHGDGKHRKWLTEELTKWEKDLAYEFENYYEEGREDIRHEVARL